MSDYPQKALHIRDQAHAALEGDIPYLEDLANFKASDLVPALSEDGKALAFMSLFLDLTKYFLATQSLTLSQQRKEP